MDRSSASITRLGEYLGFSGCGSPSLQGLGLPYSSTPSDCQTHFRVLSSGGLLLTGASYIRNTFAKNPWAVSALLRGSTKGRDALRGILISDWCIKLLVLTHKQQLSSAILGHTSTLDIHGQMSSEHKNIPTTLS